MMIDTSADVEAVNESVLSDNLVYNNYAVGNLYFEVRFCIWIFYIYVTRKNYTFLVHYTGMIFLRHLSEFLHLDHAHDHFHGNHRSCLKF